VIAGGDRQEPQGQIERDRMLSLAGEVACDRRRQEQVANGS
jgi:hypothetical protein